MQVLRVMLAVCIFQALAATTALGASASLSAASRAYTQTRYPIVLVHGAGGWGKAFGVYDYWFGIVRALERGGATVIVTQVSPFHSAEVRGEQLLTHVERVVAITGARKVNLIGHSFGGLNARYVAAVRPDLVASVTTIASPNLGSELADYIEMNYPPGSLAYNEIASIYNLIGDFEQIVTGQAYPSDALATLLDVDAPGIARFNARFPAGVPSSPCGGGAAEVDGIRYFSWGGVGVWTTGIDPTDALVALTASRLASPNDGVVARCQNHLGEVLRDDYNFNHIDEVNQTLGLVSPRETNPKEVFRVHANRLKTLGL